MVKTITILEHFKNKSEFIVVERYACAHKRRECLDLIASTKIRSPMIIGYKKSEEYPDFIYAVNGKSYELKIPYGPFFLILSKIKGEMFFTDSYALTMLILHTNTHKLELISPLEDDGTKGDFFSWLMKKTDEATSSLKEYVIV